jgi:hypothetical protein
VRQRWQTRGMLARPPGEPDWLTSHLAVPTVLRLADGSLEVYASSRDPEGRSHVVRFALPAGWPEEPVEPTFEHVLEPGPRGAFDDAGAMACWLHEVDGVLRLYYIGWNQGVTVPFRNALGLAESSDGGATFTKRGGPILDRGLHDPVFVASCAVLEDGGRYRMWYVSGLRWTGNGAVYHLKHAASDDGVEWRRDGTVAIDLAPGESAISRPFVLREDGRYRMWYSHRGDAYGIGYAESDDGLAWTRRDDDVQLDRAGGWDSEMVEYPFVFDHGGRRHLLYNGNGYGRDGVGWAVLEGA